jgi:uncharacterized damage-inducible protein DinB
MTKGNARRMQGLQRWVGNMGPSTANNPWLKMALNNAWANATLYSALRQLSEGEFTAPRPGFFGSLSRTMNHVYEVDLYYVDALTEGGRGRDVFRRDDIDDIETLAALQTDADMRFASFCLNITPERLASAVTTERQDGPTQENVASLILHLVQHQVHHRGQAHVQLSDAGIAPPQLDDFYLEYGRVPSAQDYW